MGRESEKKSEIWAVRRRAVPRRTALLRLALRRVTPYLVFQGVSVCFRVFQCVSGVFKHPETP